MAKIKQRTTLEYVHLNIDGVRLEVEIDYKEMEGSIVNKDGEPREYCFVDRGRDYLGGWIRVLRALEEATKFIDDKLKAEEERKSKETVDKAVSVFCALEELEKKK